MKGAVGIFLRSDRNDSSKGRAFFMCTGEEIERFVTEEDVAFIRLAFCDPFGVQKNISIMAEELPRALETGISFDASAIRGFGGEVRSDLFLHPDPNTFMVLPWRPSRGRVARVFCDIRHPDGTPFALDCRQLLKRSVKQAAKRGVSVNFGTEFEFYLFKLNEHGVPTKIPFDNAGYMDIMPDDTGENVRREICLMLSEMGLHPESSHHEEGPGQHEIDFRFSDALTAADNAISFQSVVRTVAMQNGLCADFSPKPLPGKSGNGLHVNMSLAGEPGEAATNAFMAGLLDHAGEMTAFLNPVPGSYDRLGENKAPRYITWSAENRSQLIRIPAATGCYRRIELRSPDPAANPYLAFSLLIAAGLDGMERGLVPPEPANLNLYTADAATVKAYASLPATPAEAVAKAGASAFIQNVLPEGLLATYAARLAD